MNTTSGLNMGRLQVRPSEVLTDVKIRWTLTEGRVLVELSYHHPSGRVFEHNLSPQALRRGSASISTTRSALRSATR